MPGAVTVERIDQLLSRGHGRGEPSDRGPKANKTAGQEPTAQQGRDDFVTIQRRLIKPNLAYTARMVEDLGRVVIANPNRGNNKMRLILPQWIGIRLLPLWVMSDLERVAEAEGASPAQTAQRLLDEMSGHYDQPVEAVAGQLRYGEPSDTYLASLRLNLTQTADPGKRRISEVIALLRGLDIERRPSNKRATIPLVEYSGTPPKNLQNQLWDVLSFYLPPETPLEFGPAEVMTSTPEDPYYHAM